MKVFRYNTMMLRATFLPYLSSLVPHAQALTVNTDVGAGLAAGGDLAAYIGSRVTPALISAFAGVFFAAMVYYGFKLAAESRSSEGITNATTSMVQALFGAAVVSGAFVISDSFVTNQIVDSGTLASGFIGQGVAFLVRLVGFILLGNIVVQSFRLILAYNDGNIDTARSNLIQSFVGAAMVMLAQPVISLVLPGAFNGAINGQIVGIANFIATIFGVICVLGIIVGGIMVLVSVNESLKDRAKTLIITSLVSLIVVMASIALITILLPT